jgi:acetyl-CoA synthetase
MPSFVKQANVSGMEAYRKLCAEGRARLRRILGRLARENLLWHKPFTKVLDESNSPFFKWFHDGELNASYNCLDRHLKTQPDKVAIIFEPTTARSRSHLPEPSARSASSQRAASASASSRATAC